MNHAQKQAIRRTFAQIQPIASLAAALFYERLFAIDPTARGLFRHPIGSPGMAQQGSMLMQTIGVAVAHLDSLEAVAPAIEALARRHTTYGVTPAHYDSVGAALLWTLEQGLGDDFTPPVREAWAAVYTTLAEVMKRAAYAEVCS